MVGIWGRVARAPKSDKSQPQDSIIPTVGLGANVPGRPYLPLISPIIFAIIWTPPLP